MKCRQLIVILIIVLTISQRNGYGQFTCGKQSPILHQDKEIRYGHTAKREFPWHTTLYVLASDSSDPIYQCGGTLLTSNTVVTAAECVYDNEHQLLIPEKLIVYLGKLSRTVSKTSDQEFKVMFYIFI